MEGAECAARKSGRVGVHRCMHAQNGETAPRLQRRDLPLHVAGRQRAPDYDLLAYFLGPPWLATEPTSARGPVSLATLRAARPFAPLRQPPPPVGHHGPPAVKPRRRVADAEAAAAIDFAG